MLSTVDPTKFLSRSHQREADLLFRVEPHPRPLDLDFFAVAADDTDQRHVALSRNGHLADDDLHRPLDREVPVENNLLGSGPTPKKVQRRLQQAAT